MQWSIKLCIFGALREMQNSFHEGAELAPLNESFSSDST